MTNDHDKQLLSGTPFFRTLPVEERDRLINAAQNLNFPRHARIHEQGGYVDGLDTILEGWVRLYRTTPSGKLAAPIMLRPGDTYGQALIVHDNQQHLYTAFAVKPVRMARIPAELFKSRIMANPQILFSVNKALFEKVMASLRKTENMILMTAEQRVACHLLNLSADKLGKGATFPIPYEKYEIACHLGLSAESLSRILKKLKSVGVYSFGSEVKITSFARLARLCRPDCAAGSGECCCAARLPGNEQAA